MSRTERLRHAAGHVAGRVAGATGLADLADLEASVDSLAVAVEENATLEVPLAALVGELERDVAEVVARRAGGGMGA